MEGDIRQTGTPLQEAPEYDGVKNVSAILYQAGLFVPRWMIPIATILQRVGVPPPVTQLAPPAWAIRADHILQDLIAVLAAALQSMEGQLVRGTAG